MRSMIFSIIIGVPKNKVNKQFNGDQDELRISLDRFEHLCYMGVPQAVEVLYSPPESWIVVDDRWDGIAAEIKNNLPDHLPKVLDTYRRTALNFYKGDQKRQRHAFRLILNAEELKASGEMHSRLTPAQIESVNKLVGAFDSEDKFKDMMYE